MLYDSFNQKFIYIEIIHRLGEETYSVVQVQNRMLEWRGARVEWTNQKNKMGANEPESVEFEPE